MIILRLCMSELSFSWVVSVSVRVRVDVLYGQLGLGSPLPHWLRASRCWAMQGQSFDGPVSQGYQPPDGSGTR
jgi:hypothetical protein